MKSLLKMIIEADLLGDFDDARQRLVAAKTLLSDESKWHGGSSADAVYPDLDRDGLPSKLFTSPCEPDDPEATKWSLGGAVRRKDDDYGATLLALGCLAETIGESSAIRAATDGGWSDPLDEAIGDWNGCHSHEEVLGVLAGAILTLQDASNRLRWVRFAEAQKRTERDLEIERLTTAVQKLEAENKRLKSTDGVSKLELKEQLIVQEGIIERLRYTVAELRKATGISFGTTVEAS